MNSEKNKDKKLPDGWMLCTSKSNPGRKYYFNKRTGKSSWTKPPQVDEKQASNKQKPKKTKCNHSDKDKTVETPKKTLKRKSDSNKGPIEIQIKKQKEERPTTTTTPTPEKLNQSASRNHNASSSSLNNDSPQNAPKKNIASARLSQLQAQLATEVQKENAASEKASNSPTTTEPPSKVQKTDLKSPTLNESKCSTQSPSSDSHQSIPSPSQFLTANKIIYSMKAQIPERFSDRLPQVDTFAEIAEGINNQTTEYSSMKHPATPPQFSEASKIVSAIKTKLSYDVSASKELAIKTFKTAKDRMEAFRASLENESSNTDKLNISKCVEESEPMDVDFKQAPQTASAQNASEQSAPTTSNENLVLVVDTNVFIHQLDVIKDVLNSHIKGYANQPTLLVPWRVINELDRLKDNNNGNGAICKWAKSAMDYLYKSLPENSRIKGQSLRDANSHIYPCEIPDDEILNCCLQQSERGKSVILLSNDKNLCNKATINGVKCIELNELRKLLENKPHPESNPDLHDNVQRYEDAMYQLLANILENEMRAKYNNLWEHVLFKAPPWTLEDVLQCLLKHWFAVFSEVFPRIEHLITEMKNTFASIKNKNPKSLSQSEVANLKELCVELAKKCQIIPEYMELAKLTVDRLARGPSMRADHGDMVIIAAFEGLWTVFSSYCAKLASGLGVSHSLEDKLQCDDPLSVLISKYSLFAEQIFELTASMKGALTMDGSAASEEQLARLECQLRGSLALVRGAPALRREYLQAFCNTCRNMLQEACSKFSQLTELLATCRYKIPND